MRADGGESLGARVVIAPDSFKGTLHAAEAAAAIAAGWASLRPDDELLRVPMADGGEGTLDAFETSVPGSRRMPVEVVGPLGSPVRTHWLLLPATGSRPATAVVELACTAGIELIAAGEPMRPLDASSFGFGEAIGAALDHGVVRLVLAIGGSASNDGGAGVLTALGACLRDSDGLEAVRGARGLETVSQVELAALRPLPGGGAIVLSDVRSPLLGPHGAAAVFGPQKGASPQEVARIERALETWSELLGADPSTEGAGAAGGVGLALLAWGARLVRGAEAVAELVGLRSLVDQADLVITGEGSFDAQSSSGKAPSVVLDTALDAGVPAAVVAGRLSERPADEIDAISLTDLAGGADAAMGEPERWLREAGALLAGRYQGSGRVAS